MPSCYFRTHYGSYLGKFSSAKICKQSNVAGCYESWHAVSLADFKVFQKRCIDLLFELTLFWVCNNFGIIEI